MSNSSSSGNFISDWVFDPQSLNLSWKETEAGRVILSVVVLSTEHLSLMKEEATAELKDFLYVNDHNIREQLW